MAKNVDHIQHVKSSVVIEENGVFSPKLPNPSVLADGEIAVNYAKGYETLSIKNNSGDVVTFSSDNKFYTKDFIDEKLGSGFTSENSANTVTKVIEDNELTTSSALNDLNQRKLDASAYTPTDLSNYYTKSETSGASQISTALNGKADVSDFNTHTADTSIHLTSGDVQTQIDDSISGKVNVSDVVSAITSSNSGSTTSPVSVSVVAENELTISTALNDLDDRKLDASAYTPTDLSNYYTKSETSGASQITTALSGKVNVSDVVSAITLSNSGSTNPVSTIAIMTVVAENEEVVSSALNDLNERKLDASAYTPTDLSNYYTKSETSGKTEISTALNGKANTSDLNVYADSVKYNSTSHAIEFYHGTTAGTKVFEVDASAFIIDGMVENVEIDDVTSGSSTVKCLVVSFNTDAGKQDINIPISEIFDPDAYYTKEEIDDDEEVISAALNDLNDRKLDASAYTPTDLSNYYTKSETSGASQISTALNGKQETLTASTGINIANNVISVAPDQTIDSGTSASTNAVATQAVYNTIKDTELVWTNAYDALSGVVSSHSSSYVTSMSGYTKPSTTSAISTGDTLNQAVGKLECALGGIRLQSISQSDYDALVTKDPNTLYIITT